MRVEQVGSYVARQVMIWTAEVLVGALPLFMALAYGVFDGGVGQLQQTATYQKHVPEIMFIGISVGSMVILKFLDLMFHNGRPILPFCLPTFWTLLFLSLCNIVSLMMYGYYSVKSAQISSGQTAQSMQDWLYMAVTMMAILLVTASALRVRLAVREASIAASAA